MFRLQGLGLRVIRAQLPRSVLAGSDGANSHGECAGFGVKHWVNPPPHLQRIIGVILRAIHRV